jgi:hypothetical protein
MIRPLVAISSRGRTIAERSIQICQSVMPELDNLMIASVNAMAKTVRTMAPTPWGKRKLVFRVSHAVNASFP